MRPPDSSHQPLEHSQRPGDLRVENLLIVALQAAGNRNSSQEHTPLLKTRRQARPVICPQTDIPTPDPLSPLSPENMVESLGCVVGSSFLISLKALPLSIPDHARNLSVPYVNPVQRQSKQS